MTELAELLFGMDGEDFDPVYELALLDDMEIAMMEEDFEELSRAFFRRF